MTPMTTWDLPDGWTLNAATETIETTKDGTAKHNFEYDHYRSFEPGDTMVWLQAPDGGVILLTLPFTQDDVAQAIAQYDGSASG